jgi:hypothetical protein
MMGTVIELDNHRPGWKVAYVICDGCRHQAVAALHPRAPKHGLECSQCGEMTMRVSQYTEEKPMPKGKPVDIKLGTYVHYKHGPVFTVLGVAYDSTDGRGDAPMVRYLSHTHGQERVRTLEEFRQHVRWSDGIVRPRYVTIEELIESQADE